MSAIESVLIENRVFPPSQVIRKQGLPAYPPGALVFMTRCDEKKGAGAQNQGALSGVQERGVSRLERALRLDAGPQDFFPSIASLGIGRGDHHLGLLVQGV